QHDDIHVAGALAVAQQAAFDTLGTGQHGQLGRGDRAAAVVVRVYRYDNRFAVLDVLAEVLDLIRMVMRAGILDRIRQIEDDLVVRRRLPHIHDGFADFDREIRLRRGKTLRRVFQPPVYAGPLVGIRLDAPRTLNRNIDNALAIHFEHTFALYGRSRVVQVDNGLVDAFQRIEALVDQMIPR